jgi:hypothetical protein
MSSRFRRNFAGAVYREGLLEKQVRGLLKMRDIGKNFKPMSFSDGLYSAKFPFVEVVEDRALKVLKPVLDRMSRRAFLITGTSGCLRSNA